jgi:hypothetical protein
MKSVIRTPVAVDLHGDIIWFVLIAGLQRSYPVRYTIQYKVHGVANVVAHRQSWVQTHFTDCVDHLGNRVQSMVPKRARPVPKSMLKIIPKPISRPLHLLVHGLLKVFEIEVTTDSFLSDVEHQIFCESTIEVERQKVYHHARSGLILLEDDQPLWAQNVKNGDSLFLHVYDASWEDHDSEIEASSVQKGAVSSSMNDYSLRLQEILDDLTYDELLTKWDVSKRQYKQARNDTVDALRDVKNFEKTHPEVKLRRDAIVSKSSSSSQTVG